jgi:hypothetical protein
MGSLNPPGWQRLNGHANVPRKLTISPSVISAGPTDGAFERVLDPNDDEVRIAKETMCNSTGPETALQEAIFERRQRRARSRKSRANPVCISPHQRLGCVFL